MTLVRTARRLRRFLPSAIRAAWAIIIASAFVSGCADPTAGEEQGTQTGAVRTARDAGPTTDAGARNDAGADAGAEGDAGGRGDDAGRRDQPELDEEDDRYRELGDRSTGEDAGAVEDFDGLDAGVE